MTDPLLTPAEASAQLGLTRGALAQLRYTGGGPALHQAHGESRPVPTVRSGRVDRVESA